MSVNSLEMDFEFLVRPKPQTFMEIGAQSRILTMWAYKEPIGFTFDADQRGGQGCVRADLVRSGDLN